MFENMTNDPRDILKKPYWSYDEIIDLAICCRFSENICHEDKEVSNFKIKLLLDLKDAANCRMIVPVDLAKPKSWFERYACYVEPTKFLTVTLGIIALGYFSQDMINSASPNLHLFKPGVDTKNFVRYLVVELAIRGMLALLVGWLIFLAYRGIMKYRSKSANSRLKYLMTDAFIRGFTELFFESETVIDFLNARYSFKLEKDPFRVWKEPFFKRNGDYWIVGYMGKRLCLKDRSGHEVIAHLLSRPNEEFKCNLFVKSNPDALEVDKSIIVEPSSLDEYDKYCQKVRATKADKISMESMLESLVNKREGARSNGITQDIDEFNDQIKMTERFIRENFTKSGEEKLPRDNTTKAKDAIKKAIERCISDLKKDHPFLAEHLSKTITRSFSVSYHPPENIHWDVLI